ncbi:hypothetical protein C7E12_19845 [Stenotrophomonas maltophilia]|nr:hypothetical protein C7E12_19845 [Stenotrophomonas maltophilia]
MAHINRLHRTLWVSFALLALAACAPADDRVISVINAVRCISPASHPASHPMDLPRRRRMHEGRC